MTENKSLIQDVPFHPGPAYTPPSKPFRPVMSNQQNSQSSPGIEDINANINLDFEENSSFQRPDKSFFKSLKNKGTL